MKKISNVYAASQEGNSISYAKYAYAIYYRKGEEKCDMCNTGVIYIRSKRWKKNTFLMLTHCMNCSVPHNVYTQLHPFSFRLSFIALNDILSHSFKTFTPSFIHLWYDRCNLFWIFAFINVCVISLPAVISTTPVHHSTIINPKCI